MIQRLLLMASLMGLIPLVTGCDETMKGFEKNKSDEKATYDKSDSAKKPKKATDLGDFSTADPLVASAIQSRQQLMDHEDSLLERLDEVRTLLASAKADPARLRQSIEEFLALAKDIRRVVVKANESITLLDESTQELARSTKHLGSSYKAAAGLFRERARDYSEKKLRDQLIMFADDFEAIGKTIPVRTKSIQDFQSTLPKLKSKVREATAFLDDLVLYLNSHPGIGTDPRERYATQFETFVSTFSELLRTLEEFRKTFRDQAISKAIQDGIKRDALAKQKLEEAQREELAKQERLKQAEKERQASAKREQEAKLQAQLRRDETRRQEEAKREENERKEQAKREELARKENMPAFIVIQEGHPLWKPPGSQSRMYQPPSVRGSINYTPPPVIRGR